MQWLNALPLHVSLPRSDGTYAVRSAYRVVYQGSYYPSPLSDVFTMNLILADTPIVTLNSPAGILDPGGDTLAQPQIINGTVGQWVTYTATSSIGAPLNITANGSCGAPCDPLAGGPVTSPPYMWLWAGSASSAPPADTYVTVTATDYAGFSATTNPVSTSAFQLYDPRNTLIFTCDAGVGNCISLADQADQDIPGDPPSGPIGQCSNPNVHFLFSGYGDPSMRAEQLVPDAFGTNLWLLYSYPSYNWSVASPTCKNTTTVETHLAYSEASSGPNGGASWNVSVDPVVPIFPSEPYCSGSIAPVIGPLAGTQYVCKQACAVGQPTWPTCFSSHEVPNLWPFVDSSVSPPVETWFAVHLMYWVRQGYGIDTSSIATGCLVVSKASSPTAFGWPLGSGPNTCAGQLPAGNTALPYGTLTSIASSHTQGGQSCNSWGEPAIMVAAAPPAYTNINPNAVYLAASCIDLFGRSSGYYLFFSQDLTTPMAANSWSYWGGPYKWSDSDIDLSTINQKTQQEVNSLTELDWAKRADGTIVALLTPMFVTTSANNTSYQYGCLAINFDLTNPAAPFGDVVATLNDQDLGSPLSEFYGSNGCTYEPLSNTGVVINRRLANSAYAPPSQYQTYSLMNTGVLP